MKRHALYGALSAGVLLASALPASAHVAVQPSEVAEAAFQTFTMGVPNEKEVAVIRLRLVLPDGFSEVSPTVKAGWAIETKKSGDDVTEIDWTGGTIPAGQRDDFTFSAQAPAKEVTVVWKAYQTYADGTVVSWDQAPDAAKGNDSEGFTPYSTTTVVRDLGSEDSAMPSKENWALSLSIAALALSVVSFVYRSKIK